MNYVGVVEDPRPLVEKSKDYKHSDLFGGASVWKEKGNTGWMKPILIRNQDGSLQCMAYSGAKALGMNERVENGKFVNLSPTFIYQKRANQGGGMWMQNLLDIMCQYGSPKDEWFPCDNLSEGAIADAPKPSAEVSKEALKYRGKQYFQTDPFNIDQIAHAIDMVGHCVIIIRANVAKEWTQYPIVDPTVKSSDWDLGHGICALEYGLINGKKHILVEDSWGWSGSPVGQRWLSEDFIKLRMFGGGYVIDLENQKPSQKFFFGKDLQKGMVSEDVKNLQRVLVLEGCMTLTEANTGWGIFGKMTFSAVIKLQEKYRSAILTPVGLTKGTGYVGNATRSFLNKKYA